MQSARWEHCLVSATLNGQTYLYAIGGKDASNLPNPVVEWARVDASAGPQPWLKGTNLTVPRYASACVQYGSSIYVIGGSNGNNDVTAEVSRIDLDAMTGLPMADTQLPLLPMPRASSAVVVYDPSVQ